MVSRRRVPEDGTVTAATNEDRVDAWTLKALAASRATGAPWLACMLGVEPVAASSADAELRVTPLPWEDPAGTPHNLPAALNSSSLTPREREVLESVRAVGATTEHLPGRSLAGALVAEACSGCHLGSAQAALHPSAAMLNRAGRVQGGVLFGAAAEAARCASDDTSVQVVSGHMQFVSAADPDEVIDLDPLVLRSGRQVVFARTDLRQRARLVATGSFRLQRGT